jgi:hypothetical protein
MSSFIAFTPTASGSFSSFAFRLRAMAKRIHRWMTGLRPARASPT